VDGVSEFESTVAKYEAVWAPVLAAARRHAQAEGQLSRALRLTEAEWRQMSVEPKEGAAFGKPVILPRTVLMAGRQALHSRLLIEHCPKDPDLIVELGSGWSVNLLDLYLSGGPRTAYVALEPTLAGRTAAEVLAALEPGLDFHARPFDFHHPDYTGLRGQRALVFTAHSIEQIPELSRAAITGLFDIAPTLTCVHFEPIGWQTGIRSERGATRKYAELADYNRNLWPLLQSLEAEGEITIRRMVPDFFGQKRKNTTTMVVWTRG
jgi:hypothetical protein